MSEAPCGAPHVRRRIVLTGGPGAGKTAVLELVRRSLCVHVKIVQEAAGTIFGGGFPRDGRSEAGRAAQRAIYFVQRELEVIGDLDDPAIVLCDRGTVDGSAYWPGDGTLWASVGSSRLAEMARYDKVIHLRTARPADYSSANPLRVESAAEALLVDERIAAAWDGHPDRAFVAASTRFLDKAARTLDLLSAELPDCCRRHLPAMRTPAGQRPSLFRA